MTNLHLLWPTMPLAAAAILTSTSSYAERSNSESAETPFAEAHLFFELNDTDGDLGIHALIDGDEWKRLEIDDPDDVRMLDISVRGRLREQGLTELFFESAEPPFDELAPEDFFRRFPEGVYDISGVMLDGRELDSEVPLSHVLPGPPQNVRISGTASAENCDADPLPVVSEPVIIDWDPVTRSHPELGRSSTVEVAQYQLVVEREEPTLLVFNVDLPPELTQFEVPSDFIALGDAFKFEIIVRAANRNQTAIESCFEVE